MYREVKYDVQVLTQKVPSTTSPPVPNDFALRTKWWKDYALLNNNKQMQQLTAFRARQKQPSPRNLAPLAVNAGASVQMHPPPGAPLTLLTARPMLPSTPRAAISRASSSHRSFRSAASSRASPACSTSARFEGASPGSLRQAQQLIRRKWKERFSTVQRGFLLIDGDRDGKITKAEFRLCVVMMNFDTLFGDSMINTLFDSVDSDCDGFIDYGELNTMLFSGDD